MRKGEREGRRREPRREMRRVGTGLLLVITCWFALSTAVFAAPFCGLSTQTLTFGSINPQSSQTIYTSGMANVSCTGQQANAIISVCLAIGSGDAPGSTAASRKIASGGTKIPIVIKSSPTAPQEIGTGNPYPKAGPVIFLTDGSGDGTATFPISIALSGPLAVSPGTYSNTFIGKHFEAIYAGGAQSQCSDGKSNVLGGQLTVQALVVAGCTATASAMDFGTISVLTSALAATSTITLSCTEGVTANISLDSGQTGTSPVSRQLRSSGSAIIYGIYQDAPHNFPWGQTTGVNTVSIPMGQSTSSSVTAYGLVPAQGTPAPGNFSDVVNVTITY